MHKRYNAFREEMLSNYAKFLDGEWVEFQWFPAFERDSTPKPQQPPVVQPVAPAPKPLPTPEPKKEEPKKEEPKPAPVAPAPVAPEPVAPAPAPKEEPKKEEPKKEEPKPEPVVSEPVAPAPAPKEEPKKEEPKKEEPKPEPVAPEPVAPAPAPVAPAPVAPAPVAPAPAPKEEPKKEEPKKEEPKPAPVAPAGDEFKFYEMTLTMPPIEVPLKNKMGGNSDYASQWRALASDPNTRQLIEAIESLSKKLGLNDYLTFDLTRRYVASRYPNVSASSRTSLVHYIMANLGYDVRIGTVSGGNAVILMPCKQMVYGQSYLVFGNEKYYVFTDPTVNLAGQAMSISSCRLPEAASAGNKVDLTLSPLSLPDAPKPFNISDGNLSITGAVNSNIFPIIYRYPNMPIADYARSQLTPEVRESVVEQLKEQLKDKPRAQAVEELLSFVQHAFDYATDGQAHGFEKPYFVEEILFYPQCDCEDRVIFYTYLLWNVLGVENHLITYPGHESAAVHFSEEPDQGDAYDYEGKRFLISDPTYIGAHTGMCMPAYRTKAPEIDYIYK